MNPENHYISLCKMRIAEELNLQNDSLMQRDFEYLNKVIYEKSGVDLSTATLRRIWTDERDGIPQIKTLDAMAIVLGYDGWHAFKQANPVKPKSSNRNIAKIAGQLLGVIILLLGGILISRYWISEEKIIVTLVPEKSQHEGVPATIGFNYDISNATGQEIKIQLSWNPFEQTVLDPSKNFYTGTYFYPDYHQAKLLLEDEILASSYVHITSPTWHGLIMKSGFDSNPIYVNKDDFMKNDRLVISKELSDKYAIKDLDEMYLVFTLSNEMLSQINGDSFELSTTVKGLGYLENRICSQIDIVIKGEKNSIRIPISNDGCYGITSLKCSEVELSGKVNDLSLLSTDLLISNSVKIKNDSKEVSITISENDPFQTSYTQSIGSLKVIKFIFIGFGEVSEFTLASQGETLKDTRLAPF